MRENAALLLVLLLAAGICPAAAQPQEVLPAPLVDMTKSDSEIHYPETYLITYSIYGNDGVVTFVTRGKDAAGWQCVDDAAGKRIFRPEKDYFQLVGSRGPTRYCEAYIEQQAENWRDCAQMSLICRHREPLLVGAEEVAGRSCSIYRIAWDIKIYRYSFDIWVDNETGICLKCEEESDFRGIDHWRRVKFECTEFSTEGLDFSGR